MKRVEKVTICSEISRTASSSELRSILNRFCRIDFLPVFKYLSPYFFLSYLHWEFPTSIMGSEGKLPKMEYRFLGRSGLQVSVISLGGW